MNYFQKLLDLQEKRPRMGMNSAWSTNSDYTAYCAYNKNCYLLIGSERDEDCLYGNWIYESRDCTDNGFLFKCELCYECVDCEGCYNCEFCFNCSNCFGCFYLQRKEFYIFNVPYSKEEYFKKVAEIKETMRKDGTYGKHLPATIPFEVSAVGNYFKSL